jgi:hypothetical protein
MLKPSKTLLVFFICLCLTGMIIVQARAQGGTFETEILPSQGNANTTIFLRIKTLNATVGPVDTTDIFWDNSSIALLQQGMLGADGSYNYNLTVPNQPPLSDVGNHTIQARANVSNFGSVTFDFTFTITEFVPSPEYLALNATYFSLLTNYTDLLGNFSVRTAEYTALLSNYTVLLGNLSLLLQNYNSLYANFNSLTLNYNTLIKNYEALSSLPGNYTLLQANFENLSSSYNALRKDYDSLNSSYDDVIGQFAFSRNLTYVFIASTIVLAVTTFYFATRKQKTGLSARELKTRY